MWWPENVIFDLADFGFTQKEMTKWLKVTNEDSEWACLDCGSCLKVVEYGVEKIGVGFCPRGHGWFWENAKKVKRESYLKARERNWKKKTKSKKSWDEFMKACKAAELMQRLAKGKKAKPAELVARAIEEHKKKMEKLEIAVFGEVKSGKEKKEKTEKVGRAAKTKVKKAKKTAKKPVKKVVGKLTKKVAKKTKTRKMAKK